MKTARKGLAVFLSLVMLLSALPLAAFAEEWQTAAATAAPAAEAAQTPADDAPEEPITYTGDLLSVEITAGNERTVYSKDEDGHIQLVSRETIRSGGPLRALQQPAEDQAFDIENVDPEAAYVAAKWALEHPFPEATTLLDRNGVATVIYGIGGNDPYFNDLDHDLICDDCGYCVDGCADGTIKYYSEDDIVGEPVDGKYYNAAGVLIGQDAVGTYIYQVVDEEGNPVLDENGNPKTETEEYEFIQFESYIADQDGECDTCGKPICKHDEEGTAGGHNFSDGICDGCGACVGEHVDDGSVNVKDGICDECGQAFDHIHHDSNDDDTCDECGWSMEHMHTDLSGGAVSGDGICDACGWCIEPCADADENGVCDACGKTILAYCEHSDLTGSTGPVYSWLSVAACGVCGQKPCHRTTRDMQMLQGQMGLLAAILAKGDEDGSASYHDWLTNTLTPELTAKTKDNGASADSFASLIAMRQEFRSALDEKARVQALCEKFLALSADDLTPYSLAGEVRGDTVLDDGCVYSEVIQAQNDYLAAIQNAVFGGSQAYYDEYSVVSDFVSVVNHLDSMAGAFFDAQLEAFYGSSNPTWFEINENNYDTVRKKLYNFDEAFFKQIYDWFMRIINFFKNLFK